MEIVFNPTVHKFFYALSWTFLHSLWQAAFIAIFFAIILLFLNKKSSKIKYKIWLFALAIFTISNIATYIYYTRMNTTEDAKFTYSAMECLPAIDGSHTIISANLSNPNNEEYMSILNPWFDSLKSFVNEHLYIIVGLWFLGMLLFLLRFLGGLSYLYILKNKHNFPVDPYWQDLLLDIQQKCNVKKVVGLVESSMVKSIVIIGHFKPIILFPIGWINSMDPKEVEAILAHELAHIKRNDFLINLLQSIVEIIYYFNPFVWWISAQLKEQREHSCDDVAIGICGDAFSYAKSLVKVQEMQTKENSWAMSILGSSKLQLFKRVSRMLQHEKTGQNILERIAAIIGVFFLIGIFGFKNLPQAIAAKKINEIGILSPENSTTISLSRLDSFVLNRKVENGTYTYTDHMLTSSIVVKDNKVMSLQFNNVDLKPEDFPKFENFFYDIIASHYSTSNASNSSSSNSISSSAHAYTTNEPDSLDSNVSFNIKSNSTNNGKNQSSFSFEVNSDKSPNSKHEHIITTKQSKDGITTEVIVDKNGNATVSKYKNGKLIERVIKNVEDEISMNITNDSDSEIQANMYAAEEAAEAQDRQTDALNDQLDELKDQIEELKDRLENLNLDNSQLIERKNKLEDVVKHIKDKVSKNFTPNNDNLRSLFKSMNELHHDMQKLEHLQEKLKNDSEALKYMYDISTNKYTGTDPEENWKSKMRNLMIEDGYYQESDNINFQWKNGVIRINGVEVSKDHHDKYLEIYNQTHKYKITDETIFSYNWTENNR